MKIYTDGSCLGNPGPGGWAAVIILDGDIYEFYSFEKETTNNRMELSAAINGVKIASEFFSGKKIDIYTDSQYVRNGITIWSKNWIKNGWKKSDNKPVKNYDLWQELIKESSILLLEWHWVKAHDINEYNNRADYLANQSARLQMSSDLQLKPTKKII